MGPVSGGSGESPCRDPDSAGFSQEPGKVVLPTALRIPGMVQDQLSGCSILVAVLISAVSLMPFMMVVFILFLNCIFVVLLQVFVSL